MSEAYAQTAEVITAASKASETYINQAGVAAGTLLIVCGGLLFLLWILFRRLEKRDVEIADLKVKCAQEIAQAKIDAHEDAEKKVDMAWKRVDQIYQSVQVLFGKYDAMAVQVANSMEKLKVTLAAKGVISDA